MPDSFLTHIFELLGRFGLPVLLPIAVVEGPATAIIAGAMVAAGQLNALIAGILLIVADMVGDGLYYALGRFGHGPLSKRIGRWLALSPERVAPWEQRFRDHDWKLILIGKTQGFGSIILYLAGATRMNFGRYMVFNLIATLPKVALFETVGFFLGRTLLHSVKYIDYLTALFFGVALLLLGAFFLVRRMFGKGLATDQPR